MKLIEEIDKVFHENMLPYVHNHDLTDACERKYDAIVEVMEENYWFGRNDKGLTHLEALDGLYGSFNPEDWRDGA